MEPTKSQSVDPAVRRLPRLDRMHSIGFAVLALLVVGSQILLQRGLAHEIDDAPMINMAGRQRMLSQAITKISVLARQANDDVTRRRLRSELAVTLSEWTHAAQVLSEHAEELSRRTSVHVSLQADLQSLNYAHVHMVDATEAILSLLSDPESSSVEIAARVEQILTNEPTFLNAMEVVVKDFERGGDDGGEELIVALPNAPLAMARQVISRQLEELLAMPFTTDDGRDFRVSFSAGVAAFPDDGDSSSTLLRIADERLYVAKKTGRSRVQ